MAWLGTWAKRIKLTIDAGDIDTANLTNFPLMVHISASCGINAEDISCVFDELTSDANRKKIAVTTDDGTTECKVEIERWDDANEQAWLWVKVPDIDETVNTDLYLYYDHTQPDNDTNVGDPESVPAMAVWSCAAVLHLKDTNGDNPVQKDSTSNNRDGTPASMAAACFGQVGKVGNAVHYPYAAGDKIEVAGGMTALSADDTWSVEMWIYPDVSHIGLIWSRAACATIYGALLGGSPANLRFSSGNACVTVVYFDTDTTPITIGAWNHVVFVKTGATTGSIYVNGVLKKSGTLYAMPALAENMNVGNYSDRELIAYPFDGFIDEFRICTDALTAEWIKAEYESQRDHLLDWGTEEYLPSLKVGMSIIPLGEMIFG